MNIQQIIQNFEYKNFDDASLDFFKHLNVPLNRLIEESIDVNDLLGEHKDFSIIDTTYMIGGIDDNIFQGHQSSSDLKIKRYEGLLVFAISLNILSPSRTQLSAISRIFNRKFEYTPVVILFKYANRLSLSNTQRQEYKQHWREGEKVGKVSILRDIDIASPHRGHLDILQNMKITSKVTSYETLYTYWQEVFDVSLLNKSFYKELSNWYFWTLKESNVSFPNAPKGLEENAHTLRHEHNAKNVIRLLTRLLFVWFIKEKGLVPDELFDEEYIKNNLLKEFDPKKAEGLFANSDADSKYYKGVLQNLFFATLNQEMGKRAFRNEKQHRNITNLMRYKNYFENPNEFIDLVENIVPFMNGGLFECLDKPHPTQKGRMGGEVIIYEDGFSDRPDNALVVPDYIFFGLENDVDLSSEYGTKGKTHKHIKIKGLINILKSYKFTVAENTPIEEDVALDPELLGKVFENLLASYNPETKTTARKQTGSFYTPREIVSYMVDESLIAYLKTKLEDYEDKEELDIKLHKLLAYDNIQPFEEEKIILQIINAIDTVKILDPAVGSGAFPMGTLQKMVHLLHKLDPNNKYWFDLQLDKAHKQTDELFKTTDKDIQKEKLQEIHDSFDATINHPDYARKLYLIENTIFGVDIQPIAIQISKLRFFISLVVEQNVLNDKPNFGIRPLPNLESKFVTANTLIGIEKAEDNLFDKKDIKELEDKLKEVRHKLFNAKTTKTKGKLRVEDKELREEISKKLIEHGLANNTAKQLASWDPYDQNESSPFFDMEWMFGIEDGFDIVIANPPYLREKDNAYRFEPVNKSSFGMKYHQGKMDFWFYFLHKSIDIIRKDSTICFITSRYWLNSTGASKLIKRVKEKLNFSNVIDIGKLKVFDNVAGHHMISLYTNNTLKNETIYKKLENNLVDIFHVVDTNNVKIVKLTNDKLFTNNNEINFNISNIPNSDNTIILDSVYTVNQGVVQNPDKISKKMSEFYDLPVGEGVFVLSENEYTNLDFNENENNFIKIFYDDASINKFKLNKSIKKYLIYTTKNNCNNIELYPNIKKHLLKYKVIMDKRRETIKGTIKWYQMHWPRKAEYFENEKIAIPSMFVKSKAVYLNENSYFGMSANIINIKSSNYTLKYLLGILNSTFANYWFYTNGKHRGAGVDIGVSKLRQFPIKIISKEDQQPFVNIVDKIMEQKENDEDTADLETQLDNMIYELYDLSDDEIDIIEGR